MTLQQLEYIVALEIHRNFVKASNAVFVTQPTLSMQVKKLEEEIGFQIFDRSKKPISPTTLGNRFLPQARHIIREIKELKAMVHRETETVSGEYKMGIIPTIAPYLVPLFLPDFASAYPDIKLHILEMQSEDMIAAIKNDLLDIGIMATPIGEKQIREIPIYNEPFLGYFPEGYSMLEKEMINPEDLERNDFLLLDEGHCFRNQSLHLCSTEEKLKQNDKSIEFRTGSIETLKELVKKGMGYTLVPELSVLNSSSKNIRRFAVPEPSREVSIVVRKSFAREKLIEILRLTILNKIPENLVKAKTFVRVKWR